MPTQEQIDHWFGFHPPTDVTKPIFEALDAAAHACEEAVLDAIPLSAQGRTEQFAAVGRATKAFAEAINGAAPESADKTAAIRCVRLCRMAANRAILTNSLRYVDRVKHEIDGAHWQACAAVALGGK